MPISAMTWDAFDQSGSDFPRPRLTSSGAKAEFLPLDQAQAAIEGRALALFRASIATHRGSIDAHFKSMPAGYTLSELLGLWDVRIWLMEVEATQLVGARIDFENIAVTPWALDNLAPDFMAGNLVHEMAHQNGVPGGLDPGHELAWAAPEHCGLPSGRQRWCDINQLACSIPIPKNGLAASPIF